MIFAGNHIRSVSARLPFALLLLVAPLVATALAQSASVRNPGSRIVHYDVQLEPNLASRSITGTAVLTVVSAVDGAETITLGRGSLVIDRVSENGGTRAFTATGDQLVITLPPVRSWQRRSVAITFHGAPRSGLVFMPEREQLYTVFSTAQWMPVVDAPDSRATLRLRLVIPRAWQAAASGREMSRRRRTGEPDVVEWRQEHAVPAYTFGFVAGAFTSVTERVNGVTFRYLAAGMSEQQILRVFGESARMLAFFAERAGVAYSGAMYTQALVARAVGQEMAGLSVVSEDYGRAVLDDPSASGLLAHELAHQWWGNMVTCHAWTEFWLNEGVATYMVAAYHEHTLGESAYLSDIRSMRERVAAVAARGNDRSLVFPSWERPTADDRVIVYQKGALALHELRKLIGDAAFWSGIRRYTSSNFEMSVSTADLQTAMEQASRRDLGDFFAQWTTRND
jgi:aminopeptidase N